MSVLILLSALCFAMGNVIPAATNYCAQIVASEANQAVGYFAMTINQGMATYNFNLDLSNFNLAPTATCDLTQGLVSDVIRISFNASVLHCTSLHFSMSFSSLSY